MATVNQIYQMVNDAAAQALGDTAITVQDTGTLVSLGDVVLSSTTNKEQFYNALVDRIGRTVFAIREYTARNRNVMKDEMEWGAVYQKISFKEKEATNNPSWTSASQANPFDVNISTEAVQKMFSKISTWSYEDSIPDYQMFTAFTSSSAMAQFIAAIYTNISNKLAIDEENLANLAVDTYMAGALVKGTAPQKRNLLVEYNEATVSELTVEQALKDVGFLKFASREIKTVIGNMKKMSKIYNAEGMPRFTPEDKMVVEVLGQFASASDTYLQADTFHNELTKLPNYEEVAYWQAPGTSFDFDDVSKIAIQNSELVTDLNVTGSTTQSGIIAFVHDEDAVASIIHNRRSGSMYNPRSERYNIFEKADQGYMVDLSENGVVFYMAAA